MLTLLALALGACAASPEPLRLEDFMRVGVDPNEEAAHVRATLEAAEWVMTTRLEGEGWVALAFARAEERAVRVVSRRGVVAALDSHELDGLLVRHGRISLVEREDPDVDGDGRADIVVAREEGGVRCLAVLRVDASGEASAAEDDAEAIHSGSCVERLEDIDDDGQLEAMVPLAWPDLAMGDEVAAVEVVLTPRDGDFRAEGLPAAYLERERGVRLAALEGAQARRDVPAATRLAVELAALAHLSGAVPAAQVRRFDEALSGLVLSEAERDRVAEIRAVISSEWRAR